MELVRWLVLGATVIVASLFAGGSDRAGLARVAGEATVGILGSHGGPDVEPSSGRHR